MRQGLTAFSFLVGVSFWLIGGLGMAFAPGISSWNMSIGLTIFGIGAMVLSVHLFIYETFEYVREVRADLSKALEGKKGEPEPRAE